MNKQISSKTTKLRFVHQHKDKSENFKGNTKEYTKNKLMEQISLTSQLRLQLMLGNEPNIGVSVIQHIS